MPETNFISNVNSLAASLTELLSLESIKTNAISLEQIKTSIISLDLIKDNLVSLDANLKSLDITALNNALDTLSTNIDAITTVNNNKININALAVIKDTLVNLNTNIQAIKDAEQNATTASNAAQTATQKADEIKALSGVQATSSVESTQPAEVSYDNATGKFTFKIPKGKDGESFVFDAIGTLVNRENYDSEKKGFAYLANDVIIDGKVKPHFYTKQSDTLGDWSEGSPFGIGETGADGVSITGVAFTSTTDTSGLEAQAGATDTYTISLSNNTSTTFEVYNGKDAVADVLDDTTSNSSTTYSSTKIEELLNTLSTSLNTDISNIQTLLASDDTTLDELQEIVNFIKQNKADLQSLDLSNVAETTTLKHLTATLKTKLEELYSKSTLDALLSQKASKNGDPLQAFNVKEATELTHAVTLQQLNSAVGGASSGSDFVKPDNSKPLFVKANPHSITIPSGFKVKIDNSFVEKLADTTISLNTDLVIPETKTPGTDYYVYAKIDGSFYFSANNSIGTDKLIGGFHYGLVAENEAPTGNKTEAMMVEQRGIWQHSCWDLKFRPKAIRPEAMNYTPSGKWVDIYLMHEDYAIDKHSKANAKIAGGATDYGRGIPKMPLEFGGDGTITYGKFTHFQAREIAACAGKELIPNTDFANYAYGVVEGTDSSTVGETVVGNTEHYPALTSRYMEQAVGAQWIWGADIGSASGTAWESNTDSRGQTYGSPKAVLFGGCRANGSQCGSRCSSWADVVSNSYWGIGCRFACDHLQLD